ncbi:hypothetical protein OG542_40255 (plasmid) [Streptomyces violaceus]|uniref:hypothetical protein n=1 Tax=Streptomyces violaceus TaxID=1936 RepID=UPI002E1ECCBC
MEDRAAVTDGAGSAADGQRTGVQGRKRGNPEKLEADRALYERLQQRDFTGWEWELLRDDLWVYGWRILRAWMKDGTIIAKCGERGIVVPARWPEVETLTRRGDLRDEVAHEAVERAVKTFTEEYLPNGRWDPAKGATMRTYFARTCMYAFRDAYKNWAFGYRRNLFAAVSPLMDANLYAPGASYGGFEDTTAFQEAVQRILENAGPEVRAICGCIWETKMSQKEIGAELGMTARAVEGHMSRLRGRAKVLVARGEIEVPYGRARMAKAGAR